MEVNGKKKFGNGYRTISAVYCKECIKLMFRVTMNSRYKQILDEEMP